MAYTAPRTWITGEVVTSTVMNAHIRDNLNAIAPTGKLEYFIRNATAVETLINGGWLECNGVAVSRSTYSALDTFLAALTPARPFGAGNGTTTVNVPDGQGRMLLAHASAGGHADMTGLGNNDGVALANRRPKHRHTGHTHTVDLGGNGAGGALFFNPKNSNITGQNQTSSSVDGGSGNVNDPLDAPAYLVGGVWGIKT